MTWPASPGWSLPSNSLAELDQLLDHHTDTETAGLLNAAGHRSGSDKPFAARIVLDLRVGNKLPSHAERLRVKGLLTTGELAQRLRAPACETHCSKTPSGPHQTTLDCL